MKQILAVYMYNKTVKEFAAFSKEGGRFLGNVPLEDAYFFDSTEDELIPDGFSVEWYYPGMTKEDIDKMKYDNRYRDVIKNKALQRILQLYSLVRIAPMMFRLYWPIIRLHHKHH